MRVDPGILTGLDLGRYSPTPAPSKPKSNNHSSSSHHTLGVICAHHNNEYNNLCHCLLPDCDSLGVYVARSPSKMVSSRKRGRQEMEAVEPPRERSLIDRIRNMWEFANLAQWIFIFGRAVKIDENLDIEVHNLPPALHRPVPLQAWMLIVLL
jgi:hypothetical protein